MLVVTELGSSTPLRQASVEAGNWMAAIKEGRKSMGEPAAVPAGSSCQVAPDGKVTVHAPLERRTYLLYPEGSAAAAQLGQAGAAPAPAPQPPPRRERPKTMAYVPESPIVPPGQAAPPPGAPAKRPRPKTIAYMPGSAQPEAPSPSREIAIGVPGAAPARPSREPEPPPVEARAPAKSGTAPYELLMARDEGPSEENPLHYRERAFVVPRDTPPSEAEALARTKLKALQDERVESASGLFLHVTVYDHVWKGHPSRPAMVSLQWKDWRDELTVQYPLAEYASRMTAPPILDQGRHRLDVRQRFALANEAFDDISFLTTAEDAIVFATRLAEELVGAQVIAGSLYDMGSDELRICAERGTAGRLGAGLPRGRGLLAVAAGELDNVLASDQPKRDPRFDPSIDAAPGIDATGLLWVPLSHKGDLLGMLQLVNHVPDGVFSQEDAAVALGIAQRVSDFIHRLHRNEALRQRA
jgi:hypothetical protein